MNKKNSLIFEQNEKQKNDPHFFYNNTAYYFKYITAYYCNEVHHFTNSVYTHKKLTVTLNFATLAQEITLQASTHQLKHYKCLSQLNSAISLYRYLQLTKCDDKQQPLSFDLLHENATILLSHKGAKLVYKNNKTEFVVQKIIQKEQQITFIISATESLQVNVSCLSDSALFILIANKYVDHTTIENKNTKDSPVVKKGKFFLQAVFIMFGLNGISNMLFNLGAFYNNSIIEVLSVLSGIVLTVQIATFPAFWLVNKYNSKKLAKQQK